MLPMAYPEFVARLRTNIKKMLLTLPKVGKKCCPAQKKKRKKKLSRPRWIDPPPNPLRSIRYILSSIRHCVNMPVGKKLIVTVAEEKQTKMQI